MPRLGVQEPAVEPELRGGGCVPGCPWLVVNAEVDAWFFTAWHPGRVRSIFMDGERMCVEVRWDAEDSVTVFGPESIRPRAKVAILEAAASGPSAASINTATPSAGAGQLGYAQGAYSVTSSS